MSIMDHLISSLCSLRTLMSLLSYSLSKSEAMIIDKGLDDPKNTYFNESGNGFRSNLGGFFIEWRGINTKDRRGPIWLSISRYPLKKQSLIKNFLHQSCYLPLCLGNSELNIF